MSITPKRNSLTFFCLETKETKNFINLEFENEYKNARIPAN